MDLADTRSLAVWSNSAGQARQASLVVGNRLTRLFEHVSLGAHDWRGAANSLAPLAANRGGASVFAVPSRRPSELLNAENIVSHVRGHETPGSAMWGQQLSSAVGLVGGFAGDGSVSVESSPEPRQLGWEDFDLAYMPGIGSRRVSDVGAASLALRRFLAVGTSAHVNFGSAGVAAADLAVTDQSA